MQDLAPTSGTATPATTPSQPVGLPPYARPTSGMNPMHSKTESTLAPTSEYARLLLLALGSRYVARGFIGEWFDSNTWRFLKEPANKLLNIPFFTKNRATAINKILESYEDALKNFEGTASEFIREHPDIYAPMRKELHKWRIDASKEIPKIIDDARSAAKSGRLTFDPKDATAEYETAWGRLRDHIRKGADDIGYGLALGVGGAFLSLTYSNLVRSDIRNMFSEVVAYEKGTSPDQVKFSDISASKNKIIQRTVHNYWSKMLERLAVDGLFVPAAFTKSPHIVDGVLGIKVAQEVVNTWKRRPSLFEDLVTVVNNKINPRNGLGQPITVGEVFDLYQHYCEKFTPENMFSNVVERGTGEGVVWANNQPIFQRIADLMNLTYAYKHPSILDESGKAIHQANFPLPKLIYLMGHDLLDTHNPQQTLAYIEVANRHGMGAVKDMQAMLSHGDPLEAVTRKYPIPDVSQEIAEARAPLIEDVNSITKVNHADKALDMPETTVTGQRKLLETALIPEQAVAAL